MGAFNINITGVGGHGCERKAKAGEKLYGRCGRFTCPDCIAYEFVQRMKQAGMIREGDQAYSVELADDDPLAVEYRKLKAEYEATPIDGLPQEHRSRIGVGLRDRKPYWQVTLLPVAESQDGKVYRKFMHVAEFTHWPGDKNTVVDDMLKNERASGSF
jgi:hypothetical protein